MTITTKYDIGQEVYFLDPMCAGFSPSRGKVVGIDIKVEKGNEEPSIIYKVVNRTQIHFDSKGDSLFPSLSDFKKRLIWEIEHMCGEEDNNDTPF